MGVQMLKSGLQPTSLIFLSVALFVVSFGFTQEHQRVNVLREECEAQRREARHLHELENDLNELEERAAKEHAGRVQAEKRLQELTKLQTMN